MFFIGGIMPGMKQLDFGQTGICPRCGSYGRYQVYMTYLCFTFFFIPLFRWNRKFYVKMSCCGAVYALSREAGMAILRGRDIEIEESDLTPVQDGDSWDGAGGSGQTGSGWNAGGWQNTGRTRRCPSCGYETDEDFTYCPKCGTRLEEK
jgi:hypothetical protein